MKGLAGVERALVVLCGTVPGGGLSAGVRCTMI